MQETEVISIEWKRATRLQREKQITKHSTLHGGSLALPNLETVLVLPNLVF